MCARAHPLLAQVGIRVWALACHFHSLVANTPQRLETPDLVDSGELFGYALRIA